MYLIETMRGEAGSIPLWAWHKRRLEKSMETLGWSSREIDRPEHAEAMVRLLVYASGEIVVEQRPLPGQPDPYRVAISPVVVDARDPLLYHKSSHRTPYEQARAWAEERGLHDALLCNASGAFTESTIANLIVERDGIWFTPRVADGLLPGVMRAVLLSEGRLRETTIRPEDLRSADAIYLCNAVRGVFPVELVALP